MKEHKAKLCSFLFLSCDEKYFRRSIMLIDEIDISCMVCLRIQCFCQIHKLFFLDGAFLMSAAVVLAQLKPKKTISASAESKDNSCPVRFKYYFLLLLRECIFLRRAFFTYLIITAATRPPITRHMRV